MKTLKQELQEIVDGNKLNYCRFICLHLSKENRGEIMRYRDMSKKYAKKYINEESAWWYIPSEKRKKNFIVREKYRFIKDLIAIL